MPGVASIVINVDEKGAVAALNRIDAAGRQIDPGLQKIGQRGNVVFTDLENKSRKAAQAGQLLANITGIQLPRALDQVLSKTPGVQSALNAAFAATVVITLAKEVLALVDNLTGYSEQLAKIQAQSAAIITSAQQANTTLLGPQTLKSLNDQILATTKSVESLREHFGLTGDAIGDALKRGISKYSASESILLDQMDHQSDLLNQLYVEQAKLLDQQRRLDPIEILKQQNSARLAGLEGIDKINEAERGETAVVKAEIAARVIDEKVGQAEIGVIHKQGNAERAKLIRDTAIAGNQAFLEANASGAKGEEQVRLKLLAQLHAIDQQEMQSHVQMLDQKRAAEIQAANQIAEIRRQAAEQTLQAEEDTAVAVAAPWDRANVQIQIDAQRRIRSIQQALKDSTISEQQAAIQISAVWQQTFAQMRDNLAGQLESLFDDITSGNIGKRFLSDFKKLIFQMAASWLLGLRQMQGASQVSFGGGGLLGTLLGSVFGIGGLGGGGNQPGAGGTPPFFGLFGNAAGGSGGGGILGGLGGILGLSSGSSSSGGSAGSGGILGSQNSLPLSAALGLSSGLGSGGVLPAGASSAIGFGKGAAGLAGRLAGLTAMAGLSLFGLAGKAGPAGGAALGVLGGLLTTGSLLATFPALGVTLLTALGGALTFGIGALIGGLIGLFSGLFGGGKRQRAVEQLGRQIKDNIKSVEDAYNSHQLDYDPAISQLESLRSDAQQKMHGLGGDTRTRVQEPINQAEARMKTTEAERARRLAIQFGPAQFHTGGLVRGGWPALSGRPSFHEGGEINANLLIGESVLNRPATARLGEAGVNRLNAGGGLGDVYHVTINAVDAKSFDSMLANGGMKSIFKAIVRAGSEGMRF